MLHCKSTSGWRVGFNSGYRILREALINWLCPEAGGQGCEGSNYIRNRGIDPLKNRRYSWKGNAEKEEMIQ